MTSISTNRDLSNIFSKKFIEIPRLVQKIRFYSLIFTNFINFLCLFMTFSCYKKKLMTPAYKR